MRSGLSCYVALRSVGSRGSCHDHEGLYVLEDPGGLFRVAGEAIGARRRPAGGENPEQRGGLPLRGGL